MRPLFCAASIAAWCTNAQAAVQLEGTAITADTYDFILVDDTLGVGGSLSNADGSAASNLSVRDGDASCTTALRTCAVVIELPDWILRQCHRWLDQCTDTDTRAMTWQSFWSNDLNLASWLEWTDIGSTPGAIALLAAELAVTPGGAITWTQDPADSSQSTSADSWTVDPCTPPLALSTPTAAGTLHVAAVAWSGFAPATCTSTRPATDVALEVARATPPGALQTSIFAAAEINQDNAAAVAALDRFSSTPTDTVTLGSRWIVDDDDLLDGLGIATLALDPDEREATWTVTTASGRARQHVRYLIRGAASSFEGRLSAYLNSAPLEEAIVHPIEVTAASTYTSAREWQPWQSNDTVCVLNNQWCFEAASPFPFSGLEVEIGTPATTLTSDWQYWDGGDWRSLTVTAGTEVANLTTSGTMTWELPADWQPSPVDVDGVTLDLYAVRLSSTPGLGAGATLARVAPDLALFIPGVPITGAAELRLTFNRRPIAAIESTNIDLEVDETARLDGSASSDPEGATLNYAWSQSSGPADAELTSTDHAVATARLPASGLYVFELTVDDGELDSAPAFVVVRAGTFADTDRGCDCATTPPWALAVLALALARRRHGRTVK